MFASPVHCFPPAARFAVIGVVGLAAARVAAAHEGPPFPILMDQPATGYVVSVWADPDIGEAQFFIVFESPEGGKPAAAPEVSMWVEPVSGRLDRVTCEAKRQSLRSQMQFEAKPYFDQRDMWTVGFQVTPPGGETAELTTQVESTPPGYGWWDLAIYLFPFLLLGALWVYTMMRRRRLIAVHNAAQKSKDTSSQDTNTDKALADANTGGETQ